MNGRPDWGTLIAFGVLVVFGGSNAVAVRFSNLELPPFWGATLRFYAAALVFWVIVLARRIELPKGRAMVGVLMFGLLSVGGFYAFVYLGLVRVQANLTMVVLAFVPLATFFLAVLHRLETFRWRVLGGALIATAGITLGVAGGLGNGVHIPSLLALLAGVFCVAEATVLFKLYVKGDPLAVNALGVTAGATLLLLVSALAREEWSLPVAPATWAAFVYLVLVGSVLVFYLYLYVLRRWTASVTSYSYLLFPVATVVVAAWLLNEAISPPFLVGGALVIYGVWMGAVGEPLARVAKKKREQSREVSPRPQ
jgi:drug/metabolite transporter (DMT)-like permease